MNCVSCGKELTGQQRLYCSHDCNNKFTHKRDNSPMVCIKCGVTESRNHGSQLYCAKCREEVNSNLSPRRKARKTLEKK